MKKSTLYQRKHKFHEFLLKLILAPALLFILAGCATKTDYRGHSDLSDKMAFIKAGETHKQDVVQALGSPSTKSDFGDETWYYIQSRKEAFAFFKPKIKQQNILQISFNISGLVTKAEIFNQNNPYKVSMVKKTTPTTGHSLGLFEQIFGNLGKFNKAPQEAR